MNKAIGRLLAAIFCGSFVLLPLAFGQESTVRPKKVFTPEQKAYQQQMKEYLAKLQSLEAQAKQVFDAEMAREKAGDCPDADGTLGLKDCLSKETAITDQNLKSYEELIRGQIIPEPKVPGAPAASPWGPIGPNLSDEELLAEFDRMEQSWRIYRDAACTATLHRFRGAELGP
jgi:hypothetical protein